MREDFHLAVRYFPSFPFTLDHKAKRHDGTATALGCVELVIVPAVSGILITVLPIHPNNCMCYTPLWGKERGVRVTSAVQGTSERSP